MTVPKEFLATKPTIVAMTSFEGRSTLSATAPVLSRKVFALEIPFLIATTNIITAMAIIIKNIDQIETKIIRAISNADI